MNKEKVVLGIDTSNYTTSIAIISIEDKLIANLKQLLLVKAGERGLRQSDAVFAHTVNIPKLMQQAKEYLADREIIAIGVSEKPRNQEGSYMPCFLSGLAVAESLSATLNVPVYRFSHQCGHIMAAIFSSGCFDLLESEFGAFHISGGTTELVRVKPDGHGFNALLVGGTKDLNAGQVVDRIGVHLGMRFPAGPSLEAEALKNNKKIPKKKISSEGAFVNLSGLENMAIKCYSDTGDTSLTAAFVFDYLGRAISEMIDTYTEIYGKGKIVCAGGVMCNSLIKNMLSSKYNVCFAEPTMSADNAVGIAALALRAFKMENNK